VRVFTSALLLLLAAPPFAGSEPARTVYRNPQRAPTAERYKQIQQALKDKGYNPGPIDGRWGSKTSEALRRFERDHELPADGKLDSLVLIMLGLGPKRLASVSGDSAESK